MSAIVAAIRALFGRRRKPEPAWTPSEFAEEIARRLRALLPGRQVERVAPLELVIASTDGNQRVFLDNAYRAYLPEDAAGREELIGRYVASYAEASAGGLARSREAIVPIVKDRAWLEEIRAMRAQSGRTDDAVHEDINEALIVAYAIDTPSNIAYLNEDDLRELGVQPSELRALAIRNLRHLLPRIEVQRGERLGMVVADGNYEASLLLFDDLWARESARLRGVPVVAVPARDLLLFADSADREAVEQLAAVARQLHDEASYALSDRLFCLRDGGVALWAG